MRTGDGTTDPRDDRGRSRSAAATSRLKTGLAAAGLVAGACLLSILLLPRGLDLIGIKRLNLAVAATTAIVLLARERVVRRGGGDPLARRALVALAALALLGYSNFLSFHGDRTWVHLHDVAHYYLGSKYHAELGYGDLYTAMLRAEAETHDNRFVAIEARDLHTYEQVHIRDLLRGSDRVRAAFGEARWEEFKLDAEMFRKSLGPQYGRVLLDHGFNPTPVWALIGGSLANLVPAGSHSGVVALTLIDPLLVAGALGLIARAFGPGTAVLVLLHFCVAFGATFAWTGGAFMRQAWLFGLVAFVCLLRMRRFAWAGAALALSASLRIFPLLFALPLLFKGAARAIAIAGAVGGRREPPALPSRYVRFGWGLAAGLAILVGAAALPPGGPGRWIDFGENLATHLRTISPNMVGLTEALAFRAGEGQVTQEEFEALKARRQRIHAGQILLVFFPVLALVAAASPRLTDWSAPAVLTLPLLYTGVSLASYYYVFLILVTIAFRTSPRMLALVFAAEAAPYAVMLAGADEATLYVIRGLALVPLISASLRRPLGRSLSALEAAASGGGRLSRP